MVSAKRERGNAFGPRSRFGLQFESPDCTTTHGGGPFNTNKSAENTENEPISQHAPVAQLDSASVFGTEGCRFESYRACFDLRRLNLVLYRVRRGIPFE